MQIKFLTAAPYSENGFDIAYGVPGETRDVAGNAASILIKNKHAVYAGPVKTMDEAVAEILAELRAKRAA